MNNTNFSPEHIYIHAWNLATVTNNRILKLIFDRFGSFEYAWKHITSDQLRSLSKVVDITTRKSNIDPMKEWKLLSQTPLRLLLQTDPDYPPLLKQLPKAPFTLYTQGEISAKHTEDHVFLSVVGTRRATPYSIIQTQKIIQALAPSNLIIVSGLADGIDTVAHESALLENLPTWAILGHSHNALPSYKQALAQQIFDHGGCLISEYPPNTPPEKYRFPERNRIIAGISPTTLVTEAPVRSGAIITAKIALEENREVYALVADIDRTDLRGNLDLIEEHNAIPLTSYRMLRDALKLRSAPNGEHAENPQPYDPQSSLDFEDVSLSTDSTSTHHVDSYCQKILDTLTYKYATPASQLFESSGIPTISQLLEKLSELEIEGVIEQVPGGYRLKK